MPRPLPLVRAALAAPGLSESRRAEMASAAALELCEEGRYDNAEQLVGAAAERISGMCSKTGRSRQGYAIASIRLR